MKKLILFLLICSTHLHANESFKISNIYQIKDSASNYSNMVFEITDSSNEEVFYLSTEELSEIIKDKDSKTLLQMRGPGVKVGGGGGDGSGGG